MKKYHLLLILSLSALFISCSSEERIFQKEFDVSLLQLPTQKIEVNNYENSGIDFIISPVKTTNFQKAKVISSDSTNSENESLFIYEISTKYPEKSEPLLTKLTIQTNEDGSMTSTHFVGGYELATLKYDNQGKLVDVIIPEENNSEASSAKGIYFSKQGLSYSCINKEYQRLKRLIESDMANDIICDLAFPICRTLMVMTAVESCKGNLKF